MKRFTFAFIAAMALVLVACGSQASDNNTTAGGALRDGTYRVEYSHIDSHGWKPVIAITVKGGKVTIADFDYLNPAGDRKSKDQAYQDRMKTIAGIGPMDYIPQLNAALVSKGDQPVDIVTGATSSTENFNNLANVALQNARAGNETTTIIPMDDTYSAEDAADERGWIGTVSVTYRNGSISEVVYDECQKDADGKIVTKKSEDVAYNENWAKKTPGIEAAKVYADLAARLVTTQDPALVDAVTGATGASSRFKELSAQAIAKRK